MLVKDKPKENMFISAQTIQAERAPGELTPDTQNNTHTHTCMDKHTHMWLLEVK